MTLAIGMSWSFFCPKFGADSIKSEYTPSIQSCPSNFDTPCTSSVCADPIDEPV